MQLWEGAEHLLLVETTGYTEDYKRFDYRDIQALVIQRNRFRAFGNFLLGFFLALTALPVIVYRPGLWSAAFPGFFLLFLLINTLLGPTCTVWLITSVNNQRLSCLGRVRSFRRLLERIGPRIEQVQGTLAPEEVRELAETVPLREAAPVRPIRPSAERARAERKPVGRAFHLASVLGLSCFGLLAALKIAAGNWVVFVLACAVFALTFPFVVVAIARQSTGLVDPGLRRWTWFALAFQVGGGFTAWAVLVALGGGMVAGAGVDVVELLVTGSPRGSTLVWAVHLVLALGGLLLALLGGILLRRVPPAAAAPAPPRAPPPLPAGGGAP